MMYAILLKYTITQFIRMASDFIGNCETYIHFLNAHIRIKQKIIHYSCPAWAWRFERIILFHWYHLTFPIDLFLNQFVGLFITIFIFVYKFISKSVVIVSIAVSYVNIIIMKFVMTPYANYLLPLLFVFFQTFYTFVI